MSILDFFNKKKSNSKKETAPPPSSVPKKAAPKQEIQSPPVITEIMKEMLQNADMQQFSGNPGFLNNYSGTAVFINLEKNIRKPVLSGSSFARFPGFAEEDTELLKANYEEGTFPPVFIDFGYSLEKYKKAENTFIMFWTIQPDGRYYADGDGFGGENQEEIEVYALLNDEGDFITPFKILKIGVKYYADVY